jgi:hypothetical protein
MLPSSAPETTLAQKVSVLRQQLGLEIRGVKSLPFYSFLIYCVLIP